MPINIGFIVVVVLIGVLACYGGRRFIKWKEHSGKPLVDLCSAGFASITLVVALAAFAHVARYTDGSLKFSYNLDAEPNSCLAVAVPIFLSISLGLTFAKRWADYLSACEK